MLDAWDHLPIEVLERGMVKHALKPATTDPAVPPPPPDVALPPVPPQMDQVLAALSNLALPVEAKDDSTGQDEQMEDDGPDEPPQEESNDDSSEGSDEDEPVICVKCSDLIEPSRQVKCPKCGIVLHKRCMSVNSKGNCYFCP
jgi:predicted RNA-binding Zn-ribbon protein involved in translation (DUF1610 family)